MRLLKQVSIPWKFKMCRPQCVLVLVMLYVVGVVYSWDIVVGVGDRLVFYTNGTKTDTVCFNSQRLAALVYNDIHNIILYVDKQSDNDAIGGYNLSSKEHKYFTERNGRSIQGLAFEPATEKIFFTDTHERSINWISIKSGSQNNVHGNRILQFDDGIPTDIAVDICRGYIYWITTNLTTPTIERARFDGSERQVVINTKSVYVKTYKLEPHSLVIDQQTQKIYWVEPDTAHWFYYSNYRADLDGKNKVKHSHIEFNYYNVILTDISSVLTVSNSSLIAWAWCTECSVWEEPKFPRFGTKANKLFKVHTQIPISIAANYTTQQQIQGQKCDVLARLVRSNEISAMSLSTESDGAAGMFCVHGLKINGQYHCKCTPGYMGERCDVSVCVNYCLQGNCSVNDEGLPKCSCNAGYSGERCEVYACHSYCMNNGNCSLNEKDEPVCQCVGNYGGSRCEADRSLHSGNTSTNTPKGSLLQFLARNITKPGAHKFCWTAYDNEFTKDKPSATITIRNEKGTPTFIERMMISP